MKALVIGALTAFALIFAPAAAADNLYNVEDPDGCQGEFDSDGAQGEMGAAGLAYVAGGWS